VWFFLNCDDNFLKIGSTWKYPDTQGQHCESTIVTAPIDTTEKVNPSVGPSKKRRIRNKIKKKSAEMTVEQKIKRNIKKGKWRSRQKIKKLMERSKGSKEMVVLKSN